MTTHRLTYIIPTFLLALATAACSSSSSSPAAPANTNTTTLSYSGVFAGAKEGGTFQLSATVPAANLSPASGGEIGFQSTGTVSATGTLKIVGGTTITLTGTYNLATKVFTMTGSSYSVTATVASNAVSGTYTGPSTSGTVTAYAATSGVTVTNYCGTYAGTESGRWNIVISGGVLSGVGATPDGSVQLTGTLSGSTITMTWHPNAVDSGSGTGTLSGTTITGTWSTNTPGDHGTWTGSSTGC